MSANTNEKWILVSCLQKSIRKGFEDIACMYAGQLYEIDKNYLLNKMGCVLLEDIFLANIALIDEFFTYVNQKNHKKIDVIDYVKKFCNSVKDRTAYDILEISKVKNIQEIENAEEVLKKDSSFIVDKLQAVKQILNQQILKNSLKNDLYYIEKILHEFNITPDKNLQNIIKKIYTYNKDSNYLLLGLIHQVYQTEKNKKMGNLTTGDIIVNVFKPEIINQKWLIDGIDWHTREGKSAIQDFLLKPSNIQNYIAQIEANENIDLIIGLLLFKTVGQEVNKRIFYPTAVLANKLSIKLELEKIIGHKNFDQAQLFLLFKEDYYLLKESIENIFKMPDPDSFPF